ncbi:rod-binding protein [Roseivivax sp.]
MGPEGPLGLNLGMLRAAAGSGATARGAEAQGDAAEIAKEFEAAFLSQTVDQMLKTADVGSFGGGHAEEMWRSFLSKAMAEALAEDGSVGLASQVETAIRAYQGRGETG